MDNYLQLLPMDIINHIKSFDNKQIYIVFCEHSCYSDYVFELIGIYTSLTNAIQGLFEYIKKKHLNKMDEFDYHYIDVTYIKMHALDEMINCDHDLATSENTYNLYNLPNSNVTFSIVENKLTIKYMCETYMSMSWKDKEDKAKIQKCLLPNYKHEYKDYIDLWY